MALAPETPQHPEHEDRCQQQRGAEDDPLFREVGYPADLALPRPRGGEVQKQGRRIGSGKHSTLSRTPGG